MLFKIIFNLLSSTCVKNWTFFHYVFKAIVSIYFNMFSLDNYVKIYVKYLPKNVIFTSFQEDVIMIYCLISMVTITFKMLLDFIYSLS
jgi:hypothetical protein